MYVTKYSLLKMMVQKKWFKKIRKTENCFKSFKLKKNVHL